MAIHAMIEEQKTADSARGAPRMHMRFEAPGSLGDSEGATVLIHNLSATGMLIETTSDLAIDQRLTLALPEAPDTAATVVWRSEALAGCRFDRPLSRAALSAAQLRNPLPGDVDPARTPDGGEILAQRLLRLRKERGLSRAALSDRTGFSKPSIWAWESGKTVPRRSNLMMLADAFGISERELLAGEPSAAHGDPAASAQQMHALVRSSREEIAALAGVEPGKVKITIEY
ncbi:PilZ domain-containing protein [Sphingopyxis sp. YR583]|jgi:transcriptional regulator with XRE-family HTH domain|uniref:helix-turn-helix domain-containing protein n=1 Tax=Sphingopyxis sp. YR583 TaxID=1881047 RepID=UPI0008A7F173|nr:helix-turn-helix domain-containing protein [Sphingopyxis sp. YR583]SEH13577.1 PilZ domain-containing protein [Sphingopyxis sp. YR583]